MAAVSQEVLSEQTLAWAAFLCAPPCAPWFTLDDNFMQAEAANLCR
jgi:hypothetical protein